MTILEWAHDDTVSEHNGVFLINSPDIFLFDFLDGSVKIYFGQMCCYTKKSVNSRYDVIISESEVIRINSYRTMNCFALRGSYTTNKFLFSLDGVMLKKQIKFVYAFFKKRLLKNFLH